MRILIGVDDSPHSQAAVEFVKRNRWPAGTELTVVSVVRPPVHVYAEMYAPVAPQTGDLEDRETQLHEELVSATERALRDAGLTTRGRVLRGDPREALVHAVRTEHADLLVVGSHGRTGIARLLLGSVADYVVSHAPCSVLVVKLPARAA